MPAIPCPHCGSTTTLPLPGLGDRLGAVFGAAFARRGSDLSFNNPDLVQRFNAGEIGAACRGCRKRFTRTSQPLDAPAASPARSVTERLRELEQMQIEGLISLEEYQHKRTEILKDI